MANITWKLTAGGDWDTSADWSSGVTPGTADAVSINTTAPATITHAEAVADAVASLSTAATDALSVSAGSLTVSGPATMAGAVAISGGGLALGGASTMASLAETGGVLSIAPSATLTISGADTLSGGTVSGGTLATAGETTLGGSATLSGLTWRNSGSLVAAGGTLSGVTYDGALGVGVTADSTNQYLFVSGGLTLKNAGGTGAGTATLGSVNSYGSLVFENSQTLNNATINLVSSSSGRDGSIEDEDTTGLGGNVLTLGSGLTVNSSGAATNYIGYSPGVGHEKESIVNAGAINVTSGALDIIPDNFTNTGLINLTGGVLDIGATSSFTNTGTISVSGGGTLYLYTVLTAASMAGIGGLAGGTINIDGTMNNTGTTFSVAPGASFVVCGAGTIVGGTIVDPSGLLGGVGGTLSGVTYDGTLALGDTPVDGANQYFFITGGLTLKNSAGTGNGTATLGGPKGYGTLIFDDTETLNNATINLVGSSGHYGAIEGNKTTVTLGSGLTVNSTGGGGNYIGCSADNIVNAGTINVTSGALYIGSNNFTNTGAISVTGGANVTINAKNFTNEATTILTGGIYAAVGAGSTVDIYGATTINTLNASLTLSGAGSVFEVVNPKIGIGFQIDTSLTSIGASGALMLLANRSLTSTSGVSDSGLLQLGGGTFTTSSLTVGATGKILGHGAVMPAVNNNGLIEANGGTLTMNGALTGTGTTQIDAGAILELGAASTQAVSFGGAVGTLKLDNPSSFTGMIGGLVAGDVIDLVGKTTGGPAILNGTVLSVPTSSGVLTFNLATTPAGGAFTVQSDGATGTDLIFGANAATATLTTGVDTVTQSNVTILAATNTLSAGDVIKPGGAMNTLQLTGGGTFDLRQPNTLTGVSVLDATEGAGTARPYIWLRNGLNLVVNVTSGGIGAGVTITGAKNSSTINLGSGTDVVVLGSAAEAVNGGGGADTIRGTAATAGALLTGGVGTMTLSLSRGGAVSMNAADTGVAAVILTTATSAYTFTANNEATLAISGTSGLADIVNLGSGADSVTLASATEKVNGGAGVDTIQATAATAGARLTGGTGTMTLALRGGGAAAMNADDAGVTVTLAAASSAYTFTANNEATLAISGTSGHADIIDLGSGADTVTLSTSKQTVNGGAGTDTYIVTAATIGATINGGAGSGTLSVRGGGTVTMGSNITNIQTVMLGRGTVFTANGLNLSILGSGFADTIQAGSGSDVITGDGGADTLIGGSGATTFKDVAQHLTTATLENFSTSDTIDITNLKFSTSKPTTAIWAGNVLTVTQGATVDKIKLVGSYTGTFSTKTDGANGVDITYIPPGGGSVPAFAQAMASLGDTTAASAFVAASATTATPTLLANVH